MLDDVEDDGAEFVPLASMADWVDWWSVNGEYMAADEPTCLAAALNCALVIGGGAAPLFRIGFVETRE